MNDVSLFYQQQAASHSSDTLWLHSLQKKALADFTRLGFPTRHCEDWKYTTVDSFLKQRFVSAPDQRVSYLADVPRDVGNEESNFPAGLAVDTIEINNGHVVVPEALTKNLPDGAIVLPLSLAIVLHADKLKPYLGHILQPQHAFHALNTAMLHSGVFIYLPAGVCLTNPLLLLHRQDNENQVVHIRHVVIAEEASSLKIFEHYQGDPTTAYFTNTITEVCLAAHAKVVHYKIQRESKLSYHMGHLAVKQKAGSQFDSHSFSVGGKWVRSDITIALTEPEAHCFMNGIYAPAEGQHVDHHTLVTHEAPKCSSVQDYKGILSGKSRAVFNGRVIVAKDAQHTDAKQQNKNVMLSKNAEVDTKPQLEIFADDVICTHGATVGQLDEEALFYLATRGIERTEAMRYLLKAFTIENYRNLADDEIADWLASLLNQQVI